MKVNVRSPRRKPGFILSKRWKGGELPKMWIIPDVSSESPSSERIWKAIARNVSYYSHFWQFTTFSLLPCNLHCLRSTTTFWITSTDYILRTTFDWFGYSYIPSLTLVTSYFLSLDVMTHRPRFYGHLHAINFDISSYSPHRGRVSVSMSWPKLRFFNFDCNIDRFTTELQPVKTFESAGSSGIKPFQEPS